MRPIGKKYIGNILFVDDSKVNILIGRKMLSQFGLTVTTAENGLEAIECCKNDIFQLIFLDLEMPKVGGLLLPCKYAKRNFLMHLFMHSLVVKAMKLNYYAVRLR